ncbi:zinc finger [Nesidiocoris tenuis]|uniref:Zinc finger n=1 Tax=Nesidiocoris tenuis TaxID=355587 RepID=A0ABN7B7V0_9HEMI|nr:zinc finger [Nesidiocoris tenuis]
MSSSSSSKISDHRRKWDAEEYERLASERLQAELEAQEKAQAKGPPIKRDFLRQREYKVDLDSKLGKSVVITKNTPSSQTGGYYCNVCDCIVKDSINFLDHINGKKHQRNLGMSMRVERSSLDQVKKRFEINKKKLEEKKRDYDLEQRMKEIQEEEDKLKEYRRERKKEKKRKLDDLDEPSTGEMPSELASIMGFSGFGGAKKKS